MTTTATDVDNKAMDAWRIVERVQAGDLAAFGHLYDRYCDTVFRYIYFRTGNRTLSEDLTSDTFYRGLKNIGRFQWQGRDVGAWLVTIARNLICDHFKSGRFRLEILCDQPQGNDNVRSTANSDSQPESRPEESVVQHIVNVELLTAVKQLNPEQQDCLIMRFIQGFTVAETARVMGKNEGAIKALQYRAVRALARIMRDNGLAGTIADADHPA